MIKSLQGFGYLKYEENGKIQRKVFNSNTNVNIGAQLILKKINLQMSGQTSLPIVAIQNLNNYSVSAFSVGGDGAATSVSDTCLHKMFVIRKDTDDLSDPNPGAQFLAGTYAIDHDYNTEDGNTVTLFPTANLDASCNTADSSYKNHYYWKKIAQVEYTSPNAVKYTLNLSDKDVQDATLADVSDTSLTINEFGLFICMWDNSTGQVVEDTASQSYPKIMLARLTDSYIKTQNSSIIIEWTVGII